MAVTWLTASLDTPGTESAAASIAFWRQVTGWGSSTRRGQAMEFATLVPEDGDPVLRVQEVGGPAAGVHVDVHVEDVAALREAAVGLGGGIITEPADDADQVVLRSPGGMEFCLTPSPSERVRPEPVRGASGRQSRVDQVCLDVAAEHFEDELAFWSALTGWPTRAGRLAEFAYLQRPPEMPLRLLFQRLGSPPPTGRTSAHLDLACEDRDAEERVHRALGATVLRRTAFWTTLVDPAGRPYCLTRRDPNTGLLPENA
jgi:predicted enzyme related to lactoylglutathione lyase